MIARRTFVLTLAGIAAASAQEPLAEMHGTLKSIRSKRLVVEVEDGNVMEFYTSHKTTYTDGKNRLKLNDLKPGDVLTIEGRAVLGGTFDAVKVSVDRNAKPAETPPQGSV